MAKVWTIYKFASKLTWIGIISAKTEEEAIEIASKEFKVADRQSDKVRGRRGVSDCVPSARHASGT
jgi:hypothetical protein